MATESDRDECEIVIERTFAAPRDLVWKCFTDPQHVAAWWGPRGFTTRVEELDLRVGGKSKCVMVGPDGTDYPVEGVFQELVPMERFVTTDEFGDESQSRGLKGILLTADFHDAKSDDGVVGTRVVLRITHPSVESKKTHEEMGVIGGWNSSLDCLAEQLATADEAPNEIVNARVLDAPRELVFDCWTDKKHASAWYGPNGFSTTTHHSDVRSGGSWRFTMHGPDGVDWPNLIEYDEVTRPARIAYRHGGDGGPGADIGFRTVVTFEDMDGRTLVTLRAAFADSGTRDEIEKRVNASEGGAQTLARLAEYVATRAAD